MTLENPALHASPAALMLSADIQNSLISIAKSGSAPEQCLAIETLGAWQLPVAREVLLEATRNDDPDVRVDALQTLVEIEAMDLGQDFLWSVENDPIGDAKVAALRGLRVEDRDLAGPLLRKLVLDRSEDDVAWEHDGADWDDWLDVQKEAIKTIGRLGIEDAVSDLLAAANDEFGQDLWNEVLGTLAELGRPGLLALIDTGQSPSERQRARTARALGSSKDPLVVKALDALSQDTSADVRLAALETMLERNAPIFDARLLKDTSPEIREFVAARSPTVATDDLIDLAIADDARVVKLAAIKRLCNRHPANAQVSRLLDHAALKLRSEPEDFIAALVEVLGRSGTNETFDFLLEIGTHNPKPDVQRAVLNTLVNFDRPETLDRLTDGITSKSQMVRLSALASLAALSGKEGILADNAAAVLLLAARGDLVSEEDERQNEDDQRREKQFGARARDDDGGNRNRIVLDREGNIVQPEKTEDPVKLSDYRKPDGDFAREEEAEEEAAQSLDETHSVDAETLAHDESENIVEFPQSTLAAILQGDEEQVAFEEEKISLSERDLEFLELAQSTLKKRRVRPDVAPNTAMDIRRIAVRLIGEQLQPAFTRTLLSCCTSSDAELRTSALISLLRRAERGIILSDAEWKSLLDLPPDNHVPASTTLLELLSLAPGDLATAHLEGAFTGGTDTDQIAALKAFARKGVTPTGTTEMLNSENRSARLAALKFLCEFQDEHCAGDLLRAAFLESGALGTELAKALSSCGACKLSDQVLAGLRDACEDGGTRRLIALQVLSRTGKEVAAI
ncbi:MAG: HEAT repeat domain-containing protein [Roseibium sp.]|uniref:HEAT repeat domain-containing protein n=1 Tax=Roseibium sp. TaxID=1936156 RepID=UPI0026219B39|nr:HEAT repeat domain-containing protein [Roseibium sp.]MCV0429134.1 HEAT repeat domain-containing protein [Roseibium sp.]